MTGVWNAWAAPTATPATKNRASPTRCLPVPLVNTRLCLSRTRHKNACHVPWESGGRWSTIVAVPPVKTITKTATHVRAPHVWGQTRTVRLTVLLAMASGNVIPAQEMKLFAPSDSKKIVSPLASTRPVLHAGGASPMSSKTGESRQWKLIFSVSRKLLLRNEPDTDSTR